MPPCHPVTVERISQVAVVGDVQSLSDHYRLLQEARATAQLNHPNIVSIFDAGETEGDPFIVMEFVQGNTLREITVSSISDALVMGAQICKALDHAHSKGIIHRDLKLENIIVTETQNLKLMDFGLARTADTTSLTEEGTIKGTWTYLAPELIQGQPASAQSDLYAFGIILYELLIGHMPFKGTINAILAQHLHGIVVPPSEHNPQIPAWVDELVLRLLSKHPEERPASAKDVLLILEEKSAVPATTTFISIPSKPRNNLPAQLTSFIGREKEVLEVRDAINKTRLVTLTGSGGTGKTRLSLQVAEEILDTFKDGVWFIEFASLSDPILVTSTVAKIMDVGEEPSRPLIATLTDWLCDKELLFVLDNCEHLIEACANFADAVLRTSHKIRILASSREALGIAGELAWHVPSLATPNPKEQVNIKQLEQYAAARLFIERAVFVNSSFSVSGKNVQAVAQICYRLDGIPLAIELAAARVKVLKVEEIAERLDDRFRLLTGGARTALPRQQTLRSLIDWSYDLLSESEKLLLRRLSVFAGGWTLEAAEAVCSWGGVESVDILDLLTRLTDKSLVVVDYHAETSHYHMLETIRQYAIEKLIESREDETVQGKHLDFFLQLAENAEDQIIGPDQAQWLNRLEREHDNFRTALQWSMRARESEEALRMAGALGIFWWKHTHYSEGRRWFSDILNGQRSSSDQALVRAWRWAGFLAFFQGDAVESRRIYTQNLEREQALGDQWGVAFSLHMLANIVYFEGDLEKVRELHEKSMALSRKIEATWVLAMAQFSLGYSEQTRGNLNLAEELYVESLNHFRRLGEKWGIGVALENLGNLMCSKGDIVAAKKFFLESLELSEELGDKDEMIMVLSGLASVLQNEGRPITSARLQGVVVAKGREYGIPLQSIEQELFDTTSEALKESMGAQAYQKELEIGMTLSLEKAVSLISGQN